MKPSFVPLCAYLLLVSAVVYSQQTYKVNPGERVMDALPSTALYAYPSFKVGIVTYTNGRQAQARMNYHKLFSEMHFLTTAGDTLSLDNETEIRSIAIATDTFYYAEGFARAIEGNRGALLLKKQSIALDKKQKNVGSYGPLAASASSESTNAVAANKVFKELVSSEEMIFKDENSYYFSNGEQSVAANKKNLLRLFPKKKKEIEQFLDANSINFSNEEDLKKAVSYVTSLLQ